LIQGLDEEWLQLILKAKSLGLTVDEVRSFFYEKMGTKIERSLQKVSQGSDFDEKKQA
jgi:DNA-binding transcriptional MerR regulator